MKNILFTLTALMALLLSSCHSEEMRMKETGKGEVSLAKFTLSVEVEIGDIEFSRASDIDVSKYIITIKDAKGEEVGNWIYGEMPEIISLAVGNYTVEAASSSQPTTGIDMPYYYGEESFTIEANKLTEVETIVCQLANICVAFVFTDEFAELIEDDFEAVLKIGDNSVTMTKDDVDNKRKAYLPAVSENNSLDITWKGTLDGEAKEGTMRQDNIQAGEMHTVNFNLDKVVDVYPFGLKVSIQIDETISRVDDMLVVNPGTEPPLEDFPAEDGGEDEGTGGGSSTDAPTIVGTDFKGSPFDIDNDVLEISKGESPTLKVTLAAEAGISNVIVEIKSEILNEDELAGIGLPSKFDLAEPGDAEEIIKGLGLPVSDQVKGKKTVIFDISTFTGMLSNLGAGNHSFNLNVVDNNSKSTKKTLRIKTI